MHITKRQIISWLTALIDAGESPSQVIQALTVIQDFTTWWQATTDQPWNPWRWTLEDDRLFLTTIPPGDREQADSWLRRFRRWLIDEGVLLNDFDHS